MKDFMKLWNFKTEIKQSLYPSFFIQKFEKYHPFSLNVQKFIQLSFILTIKCKIQSIHNWDILLCNCLLRFISIPDIKNCVSQKLLNASFHNVMTHGYAKHLFSIFSNLVLRTKYSQCFKEDEILIITLEKLFLVNSLNKNL